jgi:GNAT superfamily N-acetyltransferase
MNDFAIRPATLDDVPALATLWEDLSREQMEMGAPLSLASDAAAAWSASIRTGLGRYVFGWVAANGNVLSGFAVIRLKPAPAYFGGDPVGEISVLFVAPAWRGRGLGGRLVKAAAVQLLGLGAVAVEAQVYEANPAALSFWRSHGFATVQRQVRCRLDEVAGMKREPGGA